MALPAVIVAGALSTGLGAWAAAPASPVVYPADAEIRFERKCANADPHRVQAHAWFRAAERRALVLGNVYARRDPTRREEVFVGVRLVGMGLDGGPDWAHAPFSIRLEAVAGERRWSGPERAGYHGDPRLGAAPVRFHGDALGRMTWLDFVEPGDAKPGDDRSHRFPPTLETTASQLGLGGPEHRVDLALTLTHAGTAETLRLDGPALRVPDRIWEIQAPRSLGFFETLNPFERGGIWGALVDGARYDHCIDERREAKRLFLEEAG